MKQQHILVKAGRTGSGQALAEAYARSYLCEANNLLVKKEIEDCKTPSAVILKELKTKKATNTGFFFALFTILKVQIFPLSHLHCTPWFF